MSNVARVRGIELAYTDEGRGPAVVFLHGFPFDRSMWRGQVERLSEDFRVIAPDLRGHGGTTSTREPATMEEMAEDVVALLDELNVPRAVVCGLSMGGYVALALYRAHPSRVRALVLADTRANADTEDVRRTREENARRALAEGVGPMVGSMFPKLLSQHTRESEPEIVARVREMMSRVNPEGAAAALRGMALRRDQTDLLPKIDVPALVIVGSEDAVTPPSEAEAMHALIEGSRLQVIEGAGHVSNVERPEEFDRALAEFLEGLPS
ncbi:MAG TPA: alpha/beta fold hydrolase [Pyrinomonadaceae bacterium]|jgi:3-oxoadipate enol-lactonase|nr:alpha/beta fold hydrolase [Pyrinomonadaceae bacterium]